VDKKYYSLNILFGVVTLHIHCYISLANSLITDNQILNIIINHARHQSPVLFLDAYWLCVLWFILTLYRIITAHVFHNIDFSVSIKITTIIFYQPVANRAMLNISLFTIIK